MGFKLAHDLGIVDPDLLLENISHQLLVDWIAFLEIKAEEEENAIKKNQSKNSKNLLS